jgi:hypothetical protein
MVPAASFVFSLTCLLHSTRSYLPELASNSFYFLPLPTLMMLTVLRNLRREFHDMLTSHAHVSQENGENGGGEEMPQPHDSAQVSTFVVYIVRRKHKGEGVDI